MAIHGIASHEIKPSEDDDGDCCGSPFGFGGILWRQLARAAVQLISGRRMVNLHTRGPWHALGGAGRYVLDLPMAEPPGGRFEYCNGVSYLLSVIIQNATRMRTLAFARQHLFEPLGIQDVGGDTSPQGVDIGWGEMRLKPHDMARFGWLYLKQGRWADEQVVPSAWVDASTRGQVDATLFDRYGYQWWVDDAGVFVYLRGERLQRRQACLSVGPSLAQPIQCRAHCGEFVI